MYSIYSRYYNTSDDKYNLINHYNIVTDNNRDMPLHMPAHTDD